MQEVTIPSWALLLFGAVLLPWLVWLTLRVMGNEKDIAVREAAMQTLKTDLTTIYEEIKEGDARIELRFKEMNAKIDMFLHQEISLLKQFVRHE